MVKCPYCQMKHPENTLFCNECGFYLLEDNKEETDPLAVGEVTWMEREETNKAPREEITSPLGLKLTILSSGRDMEVPLTRGVRVRKDITSRIAQPGPGFERGRIV
jgi:hypothetical protein